MIPDRLPVYRDPLSAWSELHTFTHHVSELCQLQWDYIMEWQTGVEPRLWICAYRCFQRNDCSEQFEATDNAPFNIPLWPEILDGITEEVASRLFNAVQVVGQLVRVDSSYGVGAEEAARKGYDMRQYRTMMVATQKALRNELKCQLQLLQRNL